MAGACCGRSLITTETTPGVVGAANDDPPVEYLTLSPLRVSGVRVGSGDALWLTGDRVAAYVAAGILEPVPAAPTMMMAASAAPEQEEASDGEGEGRRRSRRRTEGSGPADGDA